MIIRQQSLPDHRLFSTALFILASHRAKKTLALDPTYPCCSFRGSIVALDEKTGRMLGKPSTCRTMADVRGDIAAVQFGNRLRLIRSAGTLFIGTGNNYTAPADVEACQNATPTANCVAADDFFDTAFALDLKTGQIKWATRLQGFDTWTVACIRPTEQTRTVPCQTSPDFDLGGSGT